jgi:hypothetical protein
MKSSRLRGFVVRLMSVALICVGFVQTSSAGIISTSYMLDNQMRDASLARIELLLARQDVEQQLLAFGVDAASVAERLRGMSHTELMALEGRLDQQLAGGDVLALVGAVFLVLLILDLVGVTDVFKSI